MGSIVRSSKRWLAAIVSGLSIQPVSQAAMVTTPAAQVETDADAALKSVEYECSAVGVRSHLAAQYTGDKTPVDGDFEWTGKMVVRGYGWRNISTSPAISNAELNEFIRRRTT